MKEEFYFHVIFSAPAGIDKVVHRKCTKRNYAFTILFLQDIALQNKGNLADITHWRKQAFMDDV